MNDKEQVKYLHDVISALKDKLIFKENINKGLNKQVVFLEKLADSRLVDLNLSDEMMFDYELSLRNRGYSIHSIGKTH